MSDHISMLWTENALYLKWTTLKNQHTYKSNLFFMSLLELVL